MDKRTWVREAIRQFEQSLIAYARRMTGDLESAREIVQETFLRLWKAIQTDCEPLRGDEGEARIRLCRSEGATRAPLITEWLFTVCRHLAVDRWRKEKKMQTIETIDERSDPGSSPETSVESKQGLHWILSCVGRLGAQEQEVIRLKFQQDLSYKEISRITGATVSHVGVILHNAIQTIRAEIRENGGLQ